VTSDRLHSLVATATFLWLKVVVGRGSYLSFMRWWASFSESYPDELGRTVLSLPLEHWI